MAYTSNPHLPRLRMQAVLMVRRGQSIRAVARHFGYSHSTVVRWVAKAPSDGRETIPTIPSRPKSHPKALAPEAVSAIVTERLKHGRCAEVVHATLAQQGIAVSLSSVKRTLARQELLKSRTRWRKKRRTIPRPEVHAPGDLVQIDTVHLLDLAGSRYYVYTLIDVYSRWAYAEAHRHLSQAYSYQLVMHAQAAAGFRFSTVQSDNGPEFSRSLYDRLRATGITLRHSRVRKPNDNAHLERFNRTIQEECFGRWPSYATVASKLPSYLAYYNNERLHMSLNYQTPSKVLVVRRS